MAGCSRAFPALEWGARHFSKFAARHEGAWHPIKFAPRHQGAWHPIKFAPREPMEDEPIEIPIDGVLDLHTFHPRDVKTLVPDYLAECRERGILEVRIIHGKGTGALRETVHAILKRERSVATFRLAGDRSGWGATLVTLRPND